MGFNELITVNAKSSIGHIEKCPKLGLKMDESWDREQGKARGWNKAWQLR